MARRHHSPDVSDTWHRYRKRPIVVQARGPIVGAELCRSKSGEIIAPTGSYVIREQDGDGEYPCDAQTFEQTYDLIDREG